ncbi:MAG: GNAT family N-acetyltransferase [Actinomycetota bacterium]
MEVAERIALGLAAVERRRCAAVPGTEVLEFDGLVLALSNLPDPSLNGAFVERPPADPASALADAQRACTARGLGFGIDLQVGRHPQVDDAVRTAGLTRLFARPAMAIDTANLASAETLAGVQIRKVSNDDESLALARVDAEAFESDLAISEAFHAPGWDAPGCVKLVAWEGAEPVASSAGYVHDGGIGVYGVAVVPRARRRGIGAAITMSTVRAFPEADVAWLFPSAMAESMYRSLGFRIVSEWEVWTRQGLSAGDVASSTA